MLPVECSCTTKRTCSCVSGSIFVITGVYKKEGGFMTINFNELSEIALQHMNNGDGTIFAKMMMTPENKIMIRRIPVGSSIGRHILSKSSETSYVIAGEGKQICDGVEEFFNTGMCIFCSKDSSQSITNIGKDDLILFTMTKE